jgi:hypothetical protein
MAGASCSNSMTTGIGAKTTAPHVPRRPPSAKLAPENNRPPKASLAPVWSSSWKCLTVTSSKRFCPPNEHANASTPLTLANSTSSSSVFTATLTPASDKLIDACAAATAATA